MKIIIDGLTYEEVEKIKRKLGAKIMKKAKIDYEVSEDVECPKEFDELPDVVAKQCAIEAYREISKCNEHLDTKHNESNVKEFICSVFLNDVRYAVKKMQRCGRNKFICRIVGMMHLRGYYGRISVDTLAIDLRFQYKGRPNCQTTRRYIFKADKENDWV